ncbi:carboxylesterase/lipase family protein [Microbacterium sp. ZW T5_56]|uniref:carboxylesterase/lipase family protein n=1 Tax=Microbacterium sp. ZW T5_56 TaxID=3378081 RepID=UPI003853B657
MSDDDVTRVISAGGVRGTRIGDTERYLGIPYAAAPFGPNRFRPPQPVSAWEGVRDALTFGPTAPQAPYQGATAELLGSVEIAGEEILTANIWRPTAADGAPVILWIHGGALERGAAALSTYDGASFARDGIVFVSINYRLGSEGFSVFDDDAPLNLGVSDAAAALRWVRAEIAAFGGDPARITLMGESAGGALVAALLSMADTRDLAAGAIIQSGPLSAGKPKKAGRITRALAKRLGVAPNSAAFAELAPEAIVAARVAQAAGSSPIGGAPAFTLALSDDLPREPEAAIVDVDIPVLIGTNTDEYRLWFPPAALQSITATKLLLARLALRIPAAAVAACRRVWPNASVGEVFGQIATEFLLRAPMLRIAAARPAPTFVYEFAWPSPVRDLRAAHALELGFVFDALGDAETKRMAGAGAPQSLADEMHSAWVAFAHTGDPGWPAYDADRLTRVFDTHSRTEPVRRAAVVDAMR